MSDGGGFDIALLEGKDRAELAAIAEQLGQKPGARAKKADIVALILRLVGADPGDAGADAAAADAGGDGGHGGGDPSAPAESSSTDGAQDDHGDDGAGEPQAAADAGPAEGASDGADDHDDRDDHDGDHNDGNRNDNSRNQGNGTGQSGGDGQGGEGQGDDSEPGNRRRRRRGRDRNRDEDQSQAEPVEVEGMVELRDEGYGFLRLHGWRASRDDAYVSVKQTRQFGLRTGDIVRGKSRAANRNERNPALIQVDRVNGYEAHNQAPRPRFEELTAVFPDEQLTLELADDPTDITVRVIDLIAPIGKGTRGLVAAPPKAGKSTVLKHIVRSIEVNHPGVDLFVVLIDERPEEITAMSRWLLRGELAASAFDRPPEEHVAMAELVVERAKRLVEQGRDVVVVFDGLTRMARACNLVASGTGRTVGGDLDATALQVPRRLFGAARNAEEGGSLTLVATATVDSGSHTDEVIFEYLQGTANMELRLDHRLAERRIHPPVDIDASGTSHDELLVGRAQVDQVTLLRRQLGDLRDQNGTNDAGIASIAERLARSATNAALLGELGQ